MDFTSLAVGIIMGANVMAAVGIVLLMTKSGGTRNKDIGRKIS